MPRTLASALAMIAAALASAPAASAADLGAGVEYGAGPGGRSGVGRFPSRPFGEPPLHGRAFEREAEFGDCRVVVRRRVNEFGEEIVRRARICEEEPAVHRLPRPPQPHHGGGDDHLHLSHGLVPPADIPDEESALR